jgi:heme ABC exporter ATP-binding subunit CcmA
VASLTDPNARLAEPRHDPAAASTPAVRLSNVTRVFGVAPAIVRVDLEVAPGQTVLVRGPNGAGKSTLLRVVATAISPTYGSGSVLGHDLLRERDAIRRRTELLGHRTRLYEDLSAAENLRFTCAIHGLDPSGVGAALDRVGLDAGSRDRIRTFSQGMRQRVAVARVLVRHPDLVLLDEPYAGLDEASKDVVDGMIAELAGAGRTVVVATHDPVRGGRADRVLSMDGGQVREAGAGR